MLKYEEENKVGLKVKEEAGISGWSRLMTGDKDKLKFSEGKQGLLSKESIPKSEQKERFQNQLEQ